MKRKSQKTIRQNKLKEWSDSVKERDDFRCVICGSTGRLNSHHIIPKTYLPLRYDLKNGITLCCRHHIWGNEAVHKNAIYFSHWLLKNRRGQYYYLLKHFTYVCEESKE